MTLYNAALNYNAPINYNGASAINIQDTHDGFRKHKPKKAEPKKIFLPEYFSNKKEIPPVLPEQWREEPKELIQAEVEVPQKLLKYDIDWDLVTSFAEQSGQKLSKILAQLDRARAEYEHQLNMQDQDFMFMAMASAHIN